MIPSWTDAPCPEPSAAHRAQAVARQASLTKPTGALGRLETLAVELAAMQGRERPAAERAPIIVFAGDHGVTAQGVSAYPSEVTVQMLSNFARGGAAIAVLARALNTSLTVIDCGTRAAVPITGVVTDKTSLGTRDFTIEPAMSARELEAALDAGRRAITRAADEHPDLVILGEMGIGNTTAASAVACALLARTPTDLAGAGTGLAGDGIARKAAVIKAGLERHGLNRGTHPLATLAAVGGFEIAALTGAIVAAAQRRIPVLVDGFIVSVAALAATRLNSLCRPWLIFSHRSAERGHGLVLEALDADPILALDLRLGEGSGAALALPLIRLAAELHNRMATFEEAAISDRAP